MNLITKGDNLVPKKKIPFWVGIDNPRSHFLEIIIENREDDPRRSWFSGSKGSGYAFRLNQAHLAYLRIKDVDNDGSFTNDYHKEELLKQAFAISLQNDSYKGIFNETSIGGDSYTELFKSTGSTDEKIITYEELIGKALQKLYA